MRKPIIAIDGPVGAGKSSTARKVAEELGFIYIDTGAMYRAVTLNALEKGIDPSDESCVKSVLIDIKVELKLIGGSQRTFINGSDVSERIRDLDVTRAVSAVSAMKAVRDKMTSLQREFGTKGGIVMEGRDIGTVVFPDAEVKIYLDASIEVRAKRRYKELIEKGVEIEIEKLEDEIRERDRLNSERAIAPLKKAADAEYIDTSGMTFNEQVSAVVTFTRKKITPEKKETKGVPPRIFYLILQKILIFLFKILYRCEWHGVENVPMEGGVIIAPNHASVLDPPIVGCVVPRMIKYLAKEELFRVPGVKDILNYSYSIPIDRGGYTKGTMKKIIEGLRDGWGLMFFPEGTRTRTGKIGEPKKGAGMVAVMADVPVVPCWIDGTYKAIPFISKVRVYFLPPFNPRDINADGKKEKYLLVSEKILCDIINLSITHNGRAKKGQI